MQDLNVGDILYYPYGGEYTPVVITEMRRGMILYGDKYHDVWIKVVTDGTILILNYNIFVTYCMTIDVYRAQHEKQIAE